MLVTVWVTVVVVVDVAVVLDVLLLAVELVLLCVCELDALIDVVVVKVVAVEEELVAVLIVVLDVTVCCSMIETKTSHFSPWPPEVVGKVDILEPPMITLPEASSCSLILQSSEDEPTWKVDSQTPLLLTWAERTPNTMIDTMGKELRSRSNQAKLFPPPQVFAFNKWSSPGWSWLAHPQKRIEKSRTTPTLITKASLPPAFVLASSAPELSPANRMVSAASICIAVTYSSPVDPQGYQKNSAANPSLLHYNHAESWLWDTDWRIDILIHIIVSQATIPQTSANRNLEVRLLKLRLWS